MTSWASLPFYSLNTHDLTKLVRTLRKEEDDAVKTLRKLLDSKDEKIQLLAAEKLLNFTMQAAEQIDKDFLQRMIAEIKFQPEKNLNAGTIEEDDDLTEIDFDTVQEIS